MVKQERLLSQRRWGQRTGHAGKTRRPGPREGQDASRRWIHKESRLLLQLNLSMRLQSLWELRMLVCSLESGVQITLPIPGLLHLLLLQLLLLLLLLKVLLLLLLLLLRGGHQRQGYGHRCRYRQDQALLWEERVSCWVACSCERYSCRRNGRLRKDRLW